jgi:hypothetical protein
MEANVEALLHGPLPFSTVFDLRSADQGAAEGLAG